MRIQWTKGAKYNLKQVEEYIGQDNPQAAIDTVIKIIKSVEALAAYPAMGRAGRIFGTRELIISGAPYIVPYRVDDERVIIIRVLHSAARWPDSL
ncbi:MAG: addiction module toxin, RelE/StbE family [Gammaproteobacteria bacterium]|jgi:toxin ParE1/3/4|nr:addiction module toxin, RelE/StbE family [Gammaproteobacteria bacterium]